jgi:hypothetical protein
VYRISCCTHADHILPKMSPPRRRLIWPGLVEAELFHANGQTDGQTLLAVVLRPRLAKVVGFNSIHVPDALFGKYLYYLWKITVSVNVATIAMPPRECPSSHLGVRYSRDSSCKYIRFQ